MGHTSSYLVFLIPLDSIDDDGELRFADDLPGSHRLPAYLAATEGIEGSVGEETNEIRSFGLINPLAGRR
jgi:hypothetical protein